MNKEFRELQRIMLPMIKNLDPTTLAADLFSVQPMTGGVGDIFSMKVTTSHAEKFIEGQLRHVLNRGWERYYGTEWVPEAVWWKIKIKGL